MKNQLETYQREIEVHKEVEKELAKRSHFCQKVIKRLKGDLKDALDGKDELGGNMLGIDGKLGHATSRSMGGRNHKASVTLNDEGSRPSEDLINFLENKLEQIEKSLVTKQSEYDSLFGDYNELQDKFN